VPESVLTILKFCFLALLYLFLFRVVRVVVVEMRAPVAVPTGPAPEARAERTSRGRSGPTRLRIVEPASRHGELFALGDEVTVGRGGGCGIALGDDTFVSQVHARFFHRDGDLYLEDLGSRNGTFINGQPVEHATRVRRGDQLQFGQTVGEALR
jgi:pSer/pThr/pTyr-binding forkhead associated (FHA) protein